jgi:hypothetical protein
MGKKFTIKINVDTEHMQPVSRQINPNTKAKHKKSTIPYRSKKFVNGSFFDDIGMLSSEQKEQEAELLRSFVKLYNKKLGRITRYKILPLDDFDFELENRGEKVVGDITEVDVKNKVFLAGDMNYISDTHLSGLLFTTIEKKLKKSYAKPTTAKFWLLIFQTDSSFAAHESSVKTAQVYLASLPAVIYDEIWYFHLFSSEPRGIIKKVWPIP